MRTAFNKYLKELGWREQRMVGGGYLYMILEDRMAIISPQIWQLSAEPDRFDIELNASLTTRRFQDYCNFILQPNEKGGFAFFRYSPPLRLEVPEINKDVAFDASARVISWVKGLDLQQCLKSNLSYPNEAAPVFSVYRFIALKMAGRGPELESILAGVKTWNQQGFNLNITPEIVERAIALDVSGGL